MVCQLHQLVEAGQTMIAAGNTGTNLPPKGRVETVTVSEPTLPETATLLGFYLQTRARGALPRRQDLPNRELAYIMPSLYILEPAAPEGLDWRMRLMGQSLVELYGMDCTGLLQSDFLVPESADEQAAHNRHVTATEEPRLVQGRMMGVERDFHEFEAVCIPIFGHDGMTKWILSGLFIRSPI